MRNFHIYYDTRNLLTLSSKSNKTDVICENGKLIFNKVKNWNWKHKLGKLFNNFILPLNFKVFQFFRMWKDSKKRNFKKNFPFSYWKKIEKKLLECESKKNMANVNISEKGENEDSRYFPLFVEFYVETNYFLISFKNINNSKRLWGIKINKTMYLWAWQWRGEKLVILTTFDFNLRLAQQL